MLIGKLIEDIYTEIGIATDGGSISDAEGKRCLNFINEAILSFNRQDFLHFTKDLVTFPPSNETEFILEGAPVKVDTLKFLMNGKMYRVKPTMLTAFVNYLDGSFGRYPRAFVYDRILRDGKMVGRIRIDRPSGFPLHAVITNNMETYEDNAQTLNLPVDYIGLIKADVQHRILSNRGADSQLVIDKEFERNKIADSIKKNLFVGIDETDSSVDELDPIRTGAGRL